MRGRLSAFGAAVAALVLAGPVAACAGDDDGGTTDGGAAAASSSTATSIVFEGDPASPFCALLREVQVAGLLEEPSSTPAEVEAAYGTVLDVLADLAEQAPPELQEDTALVLAGMAALDDALRAVGYRYDELSARPDLAVEVSRAANDPAFAVANQRIEAYKAQVCGI